MNDLNYIPCDAQQDQLIQGILNEGLDNFYYTNYPTNTNNTYIYNSFNNTTDIITSTNIENNINNNNNIQLSAPYNQKKLHHSNTKKLKSKNKNKSFSSNKLNTNLTTPKRKPIQRSKSEKKFKPEKPKQKNEEQNKEIKSPENINMLSSNESGHKGRKILTENDIWKEKYEKLLQEYNEVKESLLTQKKNNKLMKTKIEQIKTHKEKNIKNVQNETDDLSNINNNLHFKYKKSKQIEKEQLKLINQMQFEINNMNKYLSIKSPY